VVSAPSEPCKRRFVVMQITRYSSNVCDFVPYQAANASACERILVEERRCLSRLVDRTVKRCVEHPIDCVQSIYGDPYARRGHQNREYERNRSDAL
jgi:hypothetical protein